MSFFSDNLPSLSGIFIVIVTYSLKCVSCSNIWGLGGRCGTLEALNTLMGERKEKRKKSKIRHGRPRLLTLLHTRRTHSQRWYSWRQEPQRGEQLARGQAARAPTQHHCPTLEEAQHRDSHPSQSPGQSWEPGKGLSRKRLAFTHPPTPCRAHSPPALSSEVRTLPLRTWGDPGGLWLRRLSQQSGLCQVGGPV